MIGSLWKSVGDELSAQACLDNVAMIVRHHRIQASPGYRAATQECLDVLRASGVEARITTYPATGRNRAWANLTPQEWDCADAACWLLGPDGERLERLAWYKELNLSIIQRSCATPLEGVTAELAVVEQADQASAWAGRNVAGKIVLVGDGDIHRIWHHARAAGALGLLTARMTYHPPTRPEGDLADAVQYTSFWWSPDEPKGWGFVLTPRQGARLKALAAQGTVRLWAHVGARFYDGTIENLEAVIPGETAEEVLVVSHLCHPKPSANDNATGPATVMEAARTLQALIEAGRLPRPRRTIRFLHPPEMTGTYAHLAAQTEAERSRTVAALNVDMIGQNQELTGSTLVCVYPPLACPSFTGDLMAAILDEAAAETSTSSGLGTPYATFRHATSAFSAGSDHYILADPTVGIPCPMLIQWPDRFYHTSADTIDKVDPAMMRRVGQMTATYTYFLAAAGQAEVTWLATEMAARFTGDLRTAIRNRTAPGPVVRFRLERKLADLAALRRLVPDWPGFDRLLDTMGAQVMQAAEQELERLTLVSGTLPQGAPAPASVDATAGWTGPGDLAALVPQRCYPGPISLRNWLDQLAPAEQESWRSFHAANGGGGALADYLLYWADGRRPLAEICRLTELETGLRNDAWALGYMQLLGRLGLVTM